jgi:hypothetical protein
MEIQNEFTKNQLSQPTIRMPVFNNPDVVAEGWYFAMRFAPNKLLPIDRPVGQYIQYVNKIPTSQWGKHQ